MTNPIPPVRMAVAEDALGILACRRLMHDEINGLPALAEDRIADLIRFAISPPPGMLTPPTIGVIGPSNNIQATICLMLTQMYDTREWHLGEIWNFVRPDCRQHNHMETLLLFAKSCADKIGKPMTSVVMHKHYKSGKFRRDKVQERLRKAIDLVVRAEAKSRVYQQHFGDPAGLIFVYRPQVDPSADEKVK